jgi:hypothetical protein
MKQFFTICLVLLAATRIMAQQYHVDTLYYTGNIGSFINIVVLGDGYLESELGKFVADAKETVTALFKEPPFSNYQNYFNVFLIEVPSNESGAAMDPENLIDNFYGSTFGYAGIDRLLVPTKNEKITDVLANNFPSYDQVIMVVNSTKYGGSGGWVASMSTNASSNEIAFHELGHSFSNLADEYWAGDNYAHEAINMTQETNISDLRWKNWYGDFNIGLYPYEESPSWYRPHQNCKMRYLGVPFCSVCLQGIVERIHSLVSPVLSYEPTLITDTNKKYPIKFNIVLAKPIPNTLSIKWQLNGTYMETNSDSILVDSNMLNLGTNTLMATIEDTTQLSRVDNHSTIHVSFISWDIENTEPRVNAISGYQNNMTLTLSPIPFKDYLDVYFSGETLEKTQVEILNIQGTVVGSYLLNPAIHQSLNLENLDKGIYIFRFYQDNGLIASKQIIKN